MTKRIYHGMFGHQKSSEFQNGRYIQTKVETMTYLILWIIALKIRPGIPRWIYN